MPKQLLSKFPVFALSIVDIISCVCGDRNNGTVKERPEDKAGIMSLDWMIYVDKQILR